MLALIDSPADVIFHVSPSELACWRHLLILLMLFSVDLYWRFTIDFLLFDSWLFAVRVFLPRFSRRFHFCNFFFFFFFFFFFAYFASKWSIMIGLLLIATIVADNPTNVFAIFANVLAIILRLAIIAINQLFAFLLLLLLTLRVFNQWLPSSQSLHLLNPLLPFP